MADEHASQEDRTLDGLTFTFSMPADSSREQLEEAQQGLGQVKALLVDQARDALARLVPRASFEVDES